MKGESLQTRFWGGIDPGKYGALVVVNEAGEVTTCVDVPVVVGESPGYRPDVMWLLVRRLPEGCVVGLEWPQTRPGEGAQRSLHFGLGLGYWEMALVAAGVRYERVAPNKWKGRLGLPGKTDRHATERALHHAATYYPDAVPRLRTPRGRVIDGRVDALLIAHWLRTRTVGGMRAVAERFGSDSPEAQALVMRGRAKRLRGV